jgi:NTE family protein
MRIGIALGSGSARGWAHIGVLKALGELGIRPSIICGCSIGALVGAAAACQKLAPLESWVRSLRKWDIVRLLDLRLGSGLIEGNDLMAALDHLFAGQQIEHLPINYAAVATDLASGREIWLRSGPLTTAVRASIALPGLFSPLRHQERWLIDGGVTNPVPVSLCRAMGADRIIAVNLNSDIVGKHLRPRQTQQNPRIQQILDRLHLNNNPASDPGMFEVMASAINIMQLHITRSRMAGEPPDIIIAPRLAQIPLLDFDRARETISEGIAAVERQRAALEALLIQ